MSNPALTLTRFHKADKNASFADAHTVPLYGCDQTLDMEGLLENAIEIQRTEGAQPRLWSFAMWTEKHRMSDFEGSTAIVLEYHSDQAAKLKFHLGRVKWAHFTIQTETPSENRTAVIFPLAAPLDEKSFSRAASLLADDLGVYGLSEGSVACTFFVQPTAFSTVQFQDGELIDSDYLVRNKGRWIKADKFMGNESQRAAVQVEAPTVVTDASGLFEFINR